MTLKFRAALLVLVALLCALVAAVCFNVVMDAPTDPGPTELVAALWGAAVVWYAAFHDAWPRRARGLRGLLLVSLTAMVVVTAVHAARNGDLISLVWMVLTLSAGTAWWAVAILLDLLE